MECVGPLGRTARQTLAALHHGEHVRYRRAGAHAAGAVLQHCADSGRSWWGWAPWEWARLCGTSAREFVTAQTPPTESTVRPSVVALAYLLGGFTDFHRLGMFNRFHLACLIFGEPAVEGSLQRAGEVLDRWGYCDSLGSKHRMRRVFSQALLLNRSPRLDDLDTAAFVALRAHPATDGYQGSMLYALQRAGQVRLRRLLTGSARSSRVMKLREKRSVESPVGGSN
jgi:hypothetical protein